MSVAVASCAPEGDPTERVLGQWAADLALVLSNDSRFTLLSPRKGSDAVWAKLAADVQQADVVLYLGHARPDRLGGRTPVVTDSEAPAFRGRIVGAIACHAGSKLGREMVHQHGAAGFLGFDDQLCVYLGNPSVFGSVVVDALKELVDPASDGTAALQVLQDGFRRLRYHYQAVERSPAATKRQRYAANQIWLASFPNEKTAVWIAPAQGGGPGGTGATPDTPDPGSPGAQDSASLSGLAQGQAGFLGAGKA